MTVDELILKYRQIAEGFNGDRVSARDVIADLESLLEVSDG